jgi:methionyl-tRNA formyltransferase
MESERKLKIGLCASGVNGYEMARFAIEFGHMILWVATCVKDESEYEAKIADLCKKHNIRCIRKADSKSPEFISQVEESSPDLVFLLWWPLIISKEAIDIARMGWVNLHTSFLPYNRGMYPYYWAVVDKTPFGVTMHLVDEGVDSGPILFQKEIKIDTTDTGESLYMRLVPAAIQLFKESYPLIVSGNFKLEPQDSSQATFHLAKDIESHSTIELEKAYKAEDLINIMRGRTFWKGPSAYFYKDGQKYYVRIDIKKAE